MTNKYLIIEQGVYDDYSVFFIDVTNTPLNEEEILEILKMNSWDEATISGKIEGEITYESGGIYFVDLKEELKSKIAGLFSCFTDKDLKTVLDKICTKDECFKIATANDNSGQSYWERRIDDKYKEYLKGMEIYKKLINDKKQ